MARTVTTKRVLFFLYLPGCPACAMAKPALQVFAKENPTVKVIPLDATSFKWDAPKELEPKAFPSYIYHEPKRLVAYRHGDAVTSGAELGRWVKAKSAEADKG
jgi:thiol-disulfide isomerase/thioredoxin